MLKGKTHLTNTHNFFKNEKFAKYHSLYQKLCDETNKHIVYLKKIGLEERANKINFEWFKSSMLPQKHINLLSFNQRTSIPKVVMDFDVNLKNTIITTDSDVSQNQPNDIKNMLDIRLYPSLRNLIKNYSVEIFLGSKDEMISYYLSKNSKIIFQFTIPSSATYYLIEKGQKLRVVMAGLVSHENMIAQLLTLKFADISIMDIEIIGSPNHFAKLVQQDFAKLIRDIPEITVGDNILIVAGCGLEEVITQTIIQEFNDQLEYSKSFKADIVSLTYTQMKINENDIKGIITLNLNYGEIMEFVITSLLENYHCRYVFTGGAGGFISQVKNEIKPAIGTRLPITHCMNDKFEIVSLDNNALNHLSTTSMHLQVASIFLETYDWLENAKKRGSSVDIETFYIVKAIQQFNLKYGGNRVKADCGYFVSDYVGEQPLRDYSKVYAQYPSILCDYLHTIFNQKQLLKFARK